MTSGLVHSQKLQKARLSGLAQRLAALSPQGVLTRGYAIVTAASGQIIHSTGQAHPGEAISVRVSDGEFPARVEDQ
jgi:exodeoxyribonuclease VII large subunit